MAIKSNPEQTVRRLCGVWAARNAINGDGVRELPDFVEFKQWLEKNGYEHLLSSSSVSGSGNDVERWFNEEIKLI